MRARAVAPLAFVLLLGGGCSYQERYAALVEAVAHPEERRLAEAFVEDLRAGRADAFERSLGPELLSSETLSKLYSIGRSLPAGEVRSRTLVGANVSTAPGRRTVQLTYQYGFDEGWFVLAVILQRSGEGAPVVAGFHVHQVPDALERVHALTLAGKSPWHHAFLAAGLLLIALTVAAAVACVRTRGLRRKWFWLLFILLGVGGLTLNWTTGEVTVNLLRVQLISASVGATSPYAPWFVTLSLPIGAIVFLVERRRLVAAPSAGVTAPPLA
jgi:hypothetical protein